MWGYITWCKYRIAIKLYVCVCVCVHAQDLKLTVNKFWNYSFFPPSEALGFRTSQLVAYFQCFLSLAYVVANYGYCYSCCSYIIRIGEKKVVATQEHKKPTSKRNPRNSKLGKIYHF